MAHNSLGESRTELLSWINDLLGLSYTKVEQTGSGAAHCQIIDSIYNDVPLSKVKFNTMHEYDYVANFKVLQNAFAAHGIDKVVPVERLTKLKFQDNLEFLQWIKKYWDSHFPGGSYDAEGRRKGAVGMKKAGSNPRISSSAAVPLKKAPSNSEVSRTPLTKTSASRSAVGVSEEVLNNLNKQITELRITVDGVEKERDFYFNKLREIEIMVQSRESEAPGLIKDITKILYSTEEGFEVPEGENQQDDQGEAANARDNTAEEETF